MSNNINIPREEQNSDNFVDAENNSIQPDNTKIEPNIPQPNILKQDIIDYEKERRILFRIAFGFSIFFILCLYIGLFWWIYSQSIGYHINNNMWHIAVIFALPATTLLIAILKLVSKHQEPTVSSHSPIKEFSNQLLSVIKEFLNTRK